MKRGKIQVRNLMGEGRGESGAKENPRQMCHSFRIHCIDQAYEKYPVCSLE